MSKNRKMDDDELANVSGAGEAVHPVSSGSSDTKPQVISTGGSGGGGGGVSPELTDIPTGGGNFTPGQA